MDPVTGSMPAQAAAVVAFVVAQAEQLHSMVETLV
jgi:hypothetical protein